MDDPTTSRERHRVVVRARPRPTWSTAPASPSTTAGPPWGSSPSRSTRPGGRSSADAYVSPGGSTTRVWDLLLDHARTYAERRVSGLDRRRATTVGSSPAGATSRTRATPRRSPGPGWPRSVASTPWASSSTRADPPRTARALPAGVNAEVVGTHRGRSAHARTRSPTSRSRATGGTCTGPTRTGMAWCRSRLLRPDQWWLACVDGVPAAVCLGNDHLAEHGWGYVSTLGVLEEHRGRGLGRLLLETVLRAVVRREVASGSASASTPRTAPEHPPSTPRSA